MMGLQATKRELFVSISLDEYVPENHLLRAVDRHLDLSEFRQNLAESYSNTGRPSIDPELMARMLIIGYCYGIRSERRLCEEVKWPKYCPTEAKIRIQYPDERTRQLAAELPLMYSYFIQIALHCVA